ncbi:Phage tail tape measure protein, lambda family [Bosea sp. 62]|uniref:phage tail tape measure protein n=1 Tax=unclassified Bosea (in: a-proteobacteria) TaxID=2653178 RepID=UPI001256E1BC|nr:MULTISPECIES: phage tail tape measure protein [unclassified Bosea (in: a-proteobacteria)]CAD5289759.1 Phage tail tape measure protein, lambda family [Bosea sp. 7B]CAD5300240.1 Phage tail tape measure protein, lambda family [Bosea sp. 21B]CAD5300728.1 Phage tail tape measure protein, lambda family [Bosea sp. 46]VVT61942.1 Phage tail tape measure protein, lambda family [Bosea sp. EC-HK365B]VXB47205.1 Phage tail tape measure protein, lambda family [Bosea sp. 125]
MADEDDSSSFDVGGLRSLNTLTQSLSKSAQAFGKSITTAFASGIIEGKRFEDVLRSIGSSLSQGLLKSALKPLQNTISSWLGSGINSLAGLFTGGMGGGGGGGGSPVSFFADGGVVAAPSYFAMGRGLGLMGERGAEAIMPLSRGPDGKLGVRAGGGGDRRPVSVTVQVSTPDADSFRRSEAQVSAAIARAVARGNRAL